MYADILPFIDQANIYNQLNWTIPGYSWYFSSIDPAHEAVMTKLIPTYICPSSTTPTFWAYRPDVAGHFFQQTVSHYAGIAGSTRPEAMPAGSTSQGGAFFKNSRKRVGDITDGTSNTIVVGEYSGRAKGTAGVAQSEASAMSRTNGLPWFGFYQSGTDAAPNATWHGVKTIQYGPNLYWSNTDFGGSAVGTSINNQSLKSEHVGGIHALMGDGAVRFISENINLTTYFDLVDIADRHAIGEF